MARSLAEPECRDGCDQSGGCPDPGGGRTGTQEGSGRRSSALFAFSFLGPGQCLGPSWHTIFISCVESERYSFPSPFCWVCLPELVLPSGPGVQG